jgi:glycosyltransferase involved in cell wall biosynthesis
MIGVVIPAHNEERELEQCLAALRVAAADPALRGETVRVTVVLDSCSDGSRAIAERHAGRADNRDPLRRHGGAGGNGGNGGNGGSANLGGCRGNGGVVSGASANCIVDIIVVASRNVGAARAAGAAQLLALGARWLAFSDADTRVSPGWLAAQLALDVDVVCGTVAVDDWSPHLGDADALRRHFRRSYTDADGHRHIHGANLGVSASAYVRAGGFEPLACSEDVALVAALERCGARFAWSSAPRVITSARQNARASGGFGDTLLRYAASARAGLSTSLPAALTTELPVLLNNPHTVG